MAVPKRKTSKARRDQRRAHWKLTVPGIVECPQCHEPKLAEYYTIFLTKTKEALLSGAP